MDKEAIILPDGLTLESFSDILREEFGNVEIKSVGATAGSTAGSNYLSEISRLTVDFKVRGYDKSKSFIIKDAGKASSPFINMVNGMEKEISWYEKIQSQVEKLGLSVGAKCYRNSKEWMLMEDLSLSGYKTVDRKDMLDLEHSIKAVEALAKFHAATHHLHKNQKLPQIAELDTQFRDDAVDKIYEGFKRVDNVVESLKSAGYVECGEMIKSLIPDIWSRTRRCLYGEKFLSLVHGDFWTSNILFKYGDDFRVSEAKLIDFQLMRLSTPAYDLHLLICSSMKPDVRENNLEMVLDSYWASLNSTLEQVGSTSRISRDELDSMMERTGFLGPFLCLTFLPIALSELTLQFEPPQHLSPKEKEDYHAFHVVFKQRTFINHFTSLMDFYRRRKILP